MPVGEPGLNGDVGLAADTEADMPLEKTNWDKLGCRGIDLLGPLGAGAEGVREKTELDRLACGCCWFCPDVFARIPRFLARDIRVSKFGTS